MGNRITRTVLFAASALLSMSAFGAGAARFGTLRNSDWVVTNAWQAVSNKTHDLILEIGQEGSLPPDWQNVSNAAMNAVQSLQPAYVYTDNIALGLIRESTNAAVAVADAKISTNNEAFVSAVLAAPLVGADPNDLSEIAEYGTYGTVGAALLALIAGLAALKRGKLDGAAAYPEWVLGNDYVPPAIVSHKGRLWSCQNYTISEPGEEPRSDWLEVSIEDLKQDSLSGEQMDAVNSGATAVKVAAWDGYASLIAQKANATDLPYAMVEPGKWEFSGLPSGVTVLGFDFDVGGSWLLSLSDGDYGVIAADGNILSAEILTNNGVVVTATRASLPGHLCDRAVNAVSVTGATTLTLPALEHAGKARDFLVKITTSADDLNITWQGQGSEAPNGADELQFVTEDGDFPVVGTAGDYLFSFTEIEPHTFAVSMKPIVSAPQAQGGS